MTDEQPQDQEPQDDPVEPAEATSPFADPELEVYFGHAIPEDDAAAKDAAGSDEEPEND